MNREAKSPPYTDRPPNRLNAQMPGCRAVTCAEFSQGLRSTRCAHHCSPTSQLIAFPLRGLLASCNTVLRAVKFRAERVQLVQVLLYWQGHLARGSTSLRADSRRTERHFQKMKSTKIKFRIPEDSLRTSSSAQRWPSEPFETFGRKHPSTCRSAAFITAHPPASASFNVVAWCFQPVRSSSSKRKITHCVLLLQCARLTLVSVGRQPCEKFVALCSVDRVSSSSHHMWPAPVIEDNSTLQHDWKLQPSAVNSCVQLHCMQCVCVRRASAFVVPVRRHLTPPRFCHVQVSVIASHSRIVHQLHSCSSRQSFSRPCRVPSKSM